MFKPLTSLDSLRETANRGLLIVLWTGVAVNVVLALWLGHAWLAPGLTAAAFASVPRCAGFARAPAWRHA